MAFVAVSNTVAAELRFTCRGQRVAYTLGFYCSGGVTVANMTALGTVLADWWYNAGRAVHGATMVHREVYMRDLTSESGPSVTNTSRIGTVGTMVLGADVPNNAAFCISFRTAGRGRANRGRNYVTAFGTNQLTSGNTVTAAHRNALLTWYQRLLPGGASDPTPYVWVVVSRQLNGVVQGRHVAITNVIAVDDTVDSMRKRLPGRGY